MTTATTEAPTSAYPSVCTWTQETEGSDYWGTSCGGVFAINSDTPSANCMKFCAYCGGVLVESLWVDEDDSAPDLFEQPPNYAAMEAEHMGDADKQTGIYAPHVVHQAPDPFGDPDEPATLKLGTICERLGFTITAAFIADTLGIVHSATDKAAKLYRPSDFGRICAALVAHVAKVDRAELAVATNVRGNLEPTR